MIRDLAEETVDGSAFERDRLGLCLIGLFKVPMIRDLAEETVCNWSNQGCV